MFSVTLYKLYDTSQLCTTFQYPNNTINLCTGALSEYSVLLHGEGHNSNFGGRELYCNEVWQMVAHISQSYSSKGKHGDKGNLVNKMLPLVVEVMGSNSSNDLANFKIVN